MDRACLVHRAANSGSRPNQPLLHQGHGLEVLAISGVREKQLELQAKKKIYKLVEKYVSNCLPSLFIYRQSPVKTPDIKTSNQ